VLLLAQITPLADLSRVTYHWIFFQFISLSRYTVPLLQRQHHNTRKKTKIEQNAINSYHVLQFHVLQFHVLQFHALRFHALQF